MVKACEKECLSDPTCGGFQLSRDKRGKVDGGILKPLDCLKTMKKTTSPGALLFFLK
eukprot:COSAG06_NODE_556_length_14336_cov_8.683290_11_plen_57_part_00